MHPRIPLAFLADRAHCWLMVNLSSTRTPRPLSAELFSSRSTPSLYWCMGLFLPRCRTLLLPLLNLIRITRTFLWMCFGHVRPGRSWFPPRRWGVFRGGLWCWYTSWNLLTVRELLCSLPRAATQDPLDAPWFYLPGLFVCLVFVVLCRWLKKVSIFN